MSLPLVMVFERHWDTIPKMVLDDLFLSLAPLGFTNFAMEASHDLTFAEMQCRLNLKLEQDEQLQEQADKYLKRAGLVAKLSEMSFTHLVNLMRAYVSSQRYLDVAEKLKQLPATRLLKGAFERASQLRMNVQGVDIGDQDFTKIIELDLSKRVKSMDANEEYRDTTMFEGLLKLRQQQDEGIIFFCGVLHAKALMAKFKERGLQDEVLYYFPHSSGHYDESVNDIEFLMNETLQGHTHLLTTAGICDFSKRIIKEIKGKIKYTQEIAEGNSHSQFLTRCFKAHFKAYVRPGYYVDALVDMATPHIDTINQRIQGSGIETHEVSLNERKYLVIPGVNARNIAEKIRRL